jgi:M6 family metalloprotease-like protein
MMIKKRYFFLILILITGRFAFGAWVENVPQVITQPDGQVIHCFGSGDEYYHWLHDADGYTIVLNPDDGYFYYGIRKGELVVPSRHAVGKVDPSKAGLAKGARISERLYYEKRAQFTSRLKSTMGTPTRGRVNAVCIYISFADDSVFQHDRHYFRQMWSGEDQSSVEDYFWETSYQTLDLVVHHLPQSPDTINLSYKDIHPRKYYLPKTNSNPDGYSNDNAQREHGMLRRAVEYVRNQIPDSTSVDMNNDGQVDNISFIIRGNSSAWADLLWPHAWGLYTYDVRIQGAKVGSYFLTLENGFGTGTICHELGHVFGAPDLYHYNSNGAPTAVGGWCLMDASGNPPQGICGFLRYKYNHWISELPEITESGTYTILPLTSPERNLFKIKSPFSRSEYFVLEYRRKTGRYETGAPGTGLVVYRINPGAGNGNAGGPPDEVYVYRPGGSLTENGSLGSAALGVSGRKAINDKTDPNAFLWNNGEGGPGGLDIFNVTASGDSLTFEVRIIHLFPPTKLSFEPGETSVDLQWNPSLAQGLSTYFIYRNGERYGQTVTNHFRDTNVEAGQTYTYSVSAYYQGEHTGESTRTNEIIFTPMGIRNIPYEEDFNEIGHGWTISNSVEGFRWGNSESLGMPTDNATHFLGTNSVVAGDNTLVMDYAISPRLNLAGRTTVNLYFDFSLKRWQQVDRLKLFFRKNGNEDWNQIIELKPSGIGAGYKWKSYSLELPADALGAEAQIGFQYTNGGQLGYGAAIDNVTVREPAAGIEPDDFDPRIEIYPNPASEKVFIKFDLPGVEAVQVAVGSSSSGLLRTLTWENPGGSIREIDLTGLADGVYYLIINYSDKVVIRPVVKAGK